MIVRSKKRRKKERAQPSLRLICAIVALLVILISSVFSPAMSYLLFRIVGHQVDVPVYLWWLILSGLLGTAAAFLLNHFFLRPVRDMDQAMKRVAQGDFSTRLPPDVKVREIRDLFRNFNRMNDELSATEILQSDFVSNVSHEFKTPINAIEGYATLLQSGEAGDEQAMYAEKILLNTRRLSQLVGNILLLSKVENRTIGLQNTSFRLDEQIRMSLLLLEEKWTAKEIEFDVDLEPVTYIGCESVLQHVWINLLDNAIKFSPPGGKVTLCLTAQEYGRVVFTIRDEGPGIPNAELAHIFGKFYQGDSSHKADGNGLGLALVQQIVEMSQGAVQAENAPDGGAIFTVII